MNAIGFNPNQDVANRATNNIKNTLKPATTLSTSPKIDLPDDVLSLLVKMIADLLGVLRSDQRSDQRSGQRNDQRNDATTELPQAFNPPAIPSLTGGNTELPSVNAADSGVISGAATGRTLNVAPLPSLVSSTGSLSTTELPKAFNPPAIPSLTGGSTELPSVNASDSAPVRASSNSNQAAASAFTIPSLLGNGGGSTTSTRSLNNPSIFIPSLLGNSTLSALSSTQGFSLTGVNGIVDNISTSDSENSSGTRSNHFK